RSSTGRASSKPRARFSSPPARPRRTCLSRRVGREGVRADDIRPYPQSDLGAVAVVTRAVEDYRLCELESLDAVKLAPLLLMAAEEKARSIIQEAEARAAQLRQELVEENTAQGREEAKSELLPALVA